MYEKPNDCDILDVCFQMYMFRLNRYLLYTAYVCVRLWTICDICLAYYRTVDSLLLYWSSHRRTIVCTVHVYFYLLFSIV